MASAPVGGGRQAAAVEPIPHGHHHPEQQRVRVEVVANKVVELSRRVPELHEVGASARGARPLIRERGAEAKRPPVPLNPPCRRDAAGLIIARLPAPNDPESMSYLWRGHREHASVDAAQVPQMPVGVGAVQQVAWVILVG